jgi:hypothetical protein
VFWVRDLSSKLKIKKIRFVTYSYVGLKESAVANKFNILVKM